MSVKEKEGPVERPARLSAGRHKERLLASASVTSLKSAFLSLVSIQWAILPDGIGPGATPPANQEKVDQGDHMMARACLLAFAHVEHVAIPSTIFKHEAYQPREVLLLGL
jgi:hypothetical protein